MDKEKAYILDLWLLIKDIHDVTLQDHTNLHQSCSCYKHTSRWSTVMHWNRFVGVLDIKLSSPYSVQQDLPSSADEWTLRTLILIGCNFSRLSVNNLLHLTGLARLYWSINQKNARPCSLSVILLWKGLDFNRAYSMRIAFWGGGTRVQARWWRLTANI